MIAAVVPAAGRSSRMGQPKLLMTFGGETLVFRLVRLLGQGGVGRVVVVAPPASEPEGPDIASEATRAGAEVLVPDTRPAEMRGSIELGLARLGIDSPPRLVLLAPGDAPGVTADLVVLLLDTAQKRPGHIVVPSHDGRRGHPLVLPWSMAVQIFTLPNGVGVNALLARHRDSIVELPSANSDVLVDVNTPDDWHRWRLGQAATASIDHNSGLPTLDQARSSDKIQVSVHLFAVAKERTGCPEVRIDLPSTATVADLRGALGSRWPELGPLWSSALIAINEEYSSNDSSISPGSRIAVIPPVSGGARDHRSAVRAVVELRGRYP